MSTVAYGVLDLATGRLRYACAGHVPPLLIEPDGHSRFLWSGRSAPIAAYAGMKPRVDAEVRLAPGGRLLMYTDGLVERRTGNLHNDLIRLAGEASDRFGTPLPGLLTDLGGVLAGGPDRDDDVCMLCVAFGQAPEVPPAAPADAARRTSLRDDLRTWLGGDDLTRLDREAMVLG
jgi:serine/threonine-protein kinase RsbW